MPNKEEENPGSVFTSPVAPAKHAFPHLFAVVSSSPVKQADMIKLEQKPDEELAELAKKLVAPDAVLNTPANEANDNLVPAKLGGEKMPETSLSPGR